MSLKDRDSSFILSRPEVPSQRMPRVEELPYPEDSAMLFEKIADRPWSVFLDSCRPMIGQGRFDILTSDPMATVTTTGALTEIRTRQGVRRSVADPFLLLREV